MSVEPKVEEKWNEFWKELVVDKDGKLDLDQVKKELFDFSVVMENVPKVYCEVTGDTVSKIMTDPGDVIRAFHDHVADLCKEAVQDFKEENELNVKN